ncbi:serine palmitoyltransferase [Pancytospora philotis]|nr:serine palmitoyltransferase [Pancytospora philotis]
MDKSKKIPYSVMIMTYISFAVMLVMGHVRDAAGKIFKPWKYKIFFEQNGIPPLYTAFESFYIRRMYRRICDCWNRPIVGIPGRKVRIQERVPVDYNREFTLSGKTIESLNFGSYNYLGFAEDTEINRPVCLDALDRYGVNCAYAGAEGAPCEPVRTLEKEMAAFLHQEDCIVYSMGFGTNTWALSALVTDALVFSDAYNHTSLINGLKTTNATVVVFQHNDMRDLEHKLRFHITQGQPETHRSWRRIFVVVEGIYSMEGTMVELPRLVELKKKYNFFIYMDEAHSIGAIGKTGRGVCEHTGVDFKDIDFMMGTFSKSFAGAGGYVAGSAKHIDFLRACSDGFLYAEQMPPVVATQILTCLRRIIAEPERIARLLRNTRFLRRELKRLSFATLGDPVSPVVPILICTPGKMGMFSQLCLEFGLAVVVVGYPATPILESRVRLCVSSAHRRSDIRRALRIIDNVGTILGLKSV